MYAKYACLCNIRFDENGALFSYGTVDTRSNYGINLIRVGGGGGGWKAWKKNQRRKKETRVQEQGEKNSR